jgi:hypothetical protein
MRVFEYTSREKDGSIKKGQVNANDRKDALRQIHALGVVPLAISEGKATELSNGLLSSLNKRHVTFILLGLIGVSCAVVWFLTREKGSGANLSKNSKVQKHTQIAKNATAKNKNTVEKNTLAKINKPVNANGATNKVVRPPLHNQETPSGAGMSEEQKPKEDTRPYKTLTEQLIVMLGLPGEEMPPAPLDPEAHFVEDFQQALSNILVIAESDDERSAAMKENVAWIKEFMRQAREQQWTPGDYLRELQKKRQEEAALRRNAQDILSQVKQESPQDSGTARKVLDKALQDQGVIPLDTTPDEE